jgi:hypothetical protein
MSDPYVYSTLTLPPEPRILGISTHRSLCLDELSARQVLVAIDQALAVRSVVRHNEVPSA